MAPTIMAQSDSQGFKDELDDEVVTSAQRQAPSPTAHIIPDISFNAGEVGALGATDISEVIDAINAEVGDQSSGPPIILLDGRLVKSRREIRRFPSEAIRRVDVLPPEAALKYSLSPDRRVLNFVLRRRFNALTTDVRGQTTTDGGRNTGRLGTNYLRIQNQTRLALSVDVKSSEALSEDERDITKRPRNGPFAIGGNVTSDRLGDEIDPAFSVFASDTITVIGVPEAAANGALGFTDYLAGANLPNLTNAQLFRDIEPKSEEFNLGVSLFRPFGERVSVKAALNADFATSTSNRGLIRTQLDIPAANPFSPFGQDIRLYRSHGPSLRKHDKSDVEATLSIFADYPSWRWALDAEYGEVADKRDTTRRVNTGVVQNRISLNDPTLNPFSDLPVSAVAVSDRLKQTAQLKGRVNGRVARLPTGLVNGSLGFELSNVTLDGISSFSGVSSEATLSRDSARARAQVDIPLAGKTSQRRGAPGRVTARFSGALEHVQDSGVQDMGILTSFGTGLNWNAARWLRLRGSLDVHENPPSLEALGSPVLFDPNVRVTDFVTGRSVFVERLTGGNPQLKPERRRDIQFTASLRQSRNLRLSTQYSSRHIQNDTRSFPFLTPQISDIFSNRLLRDANGDLTRFDARPVNVFLSKRETLRTGFNWSKRFQRIGNRSASAAQSRAGQIPAGMGRTTGRRNRIPPDRLSVSLYHTLRLNDNIQFREGGPVLNLLDGAALTRRGGQPVHEVEVRVNIRRKNYGGGLFLTHESGKTLTTSTARGNASIGDLVFDPLTKANLRLYYDLGRTLEGRRVRRDSWRRDLRVTLDINNVGNQRPLVKTQSGKLPLAFEPHALDPQGRTVRLTLRKMFTKRGRGRGRN